MLRNILAVVAGNLAWTILWLGLNAFLKQQTLLPADSATPVDRASALLLLLGGSVIFSVAAGWLATTVAASGSYWPAVILAVLHLAIGIFFQSQAWKLMPLWYHAAFLLLIVPATLVGAWLKLRTGT